MSIDAEITIWMLPHKAYGSVISIDLEPEDDDNNYLYYQSLEGRELKGENPYINIDLPFEKLLVSQGAIDELGNMIEAYEFKFDEMEYPTRLGSTNYGVEILRGFQTLSIKWTGNEGLMNATKKLYDFVQLQHSV